MEITDAALARTELKLLNERLYNAGYSFRAQLDTVSDGIELLVEGSFDFAYYVQLHLDFRHVEFTNIEDGSKWPDAWHGDQLFLMEGSFRDEVCKALDIQIDDNVMLFRFNNSTSPQIGLVAARSLNIHWYQN